MSTHTSLDVKTSNKKIKIAFFVDSYFPMIDGVVMVVDNYARLLSNCADVAVFCPKPRNKNYKDDFRYKVVRSNRIKVFFLDYDLPIPQLSKKFKTELQDFAPDIIHIHSPFSIGKAGVKYARKHNIPLIATLHSQFKQDLLRSLKSQWLTNHALHKLMKSFNQCDECWAVNEAIRQLYIEDYGLTAPSKVQHNATDIKAITDKDIATKRMQELYGIQPNEKLFLFVGRINALKNIYLIVDSLKILKDKGYTFKMLFIGSGQDKENLEQYVQRHSLENNIIIAGRVEDRQDIIYAYARADLFLFPSLYDANSLVQIEAASQKTPTLFVHGSKTSSTVIEDVSGFMAHNDPISYARKIEEIITNQDYLDRVSKGAYEHLYKTWDNVVKDAYKNYLDIIKQKNS